MVRPLVRVIEDGPFVRPLDREDDIGGTASVPDTPAPVSFVRVSGPPGPQGPPGDSIADFNTDLTMIFEGALVS